MARYKQLMKRVERVVESIDRSPDNEATVRAVADTIIGQFRKQLGIFGGRLYLREGQNFVLQAAIGDAKPVATEVEVPLSYPPVQLVLAERILYMDAADPRTDPLLEEALGAGQFAAIEVDDGRQILAFDIAPGHDRDDILVALGILRFSINQKLRQKRLEEVFTEARRIQTSILPRCMPRLGEFDIHGRSVPMEAVGGDFYDFISVSDKSVGLAVADVSGHGLPAALQVRDIYVGMRMGLARDFKIVRTVERLNQIIHGSTLTSRFVSMFYGELELSGVFIYVNAGHPSAYLLRPDGSHRELRSGGPVLGPLRDASYERGVVKVRPGDLLVLYTDGFIEASCEDSNGNDEMFGTERFLAAIREAQEGSAAEIVEAVFAAVESFCKGCEPEDDRTLVVVKSPLNE